MGSCSEQGLNWYPYLTNSSLVDVQVEELWRGVEKVRLKFEIPDNLAVLTRVDFVEDATVRLWPCLSLSSPQYFS